jgi:VWFA-related protein
MKSKALTFLTIFILSTAGFSQSGKQKPGDEQTIRISTELVQLDVAVTDKSGQAVRGLTRNDFELYEGGKKQLISFFEFVDAVKGQRSRQQAQGPDTPPAAEPPSAQGPGASDIRRIFAFVVDDLTIRYEDLTYLRQMLSNFVDRSMQPNDLVAIVRTVGGKGLLQQFTTDKDLLRRSIASLTPVSHALSAFHNPDGGRVSGIPSASTDTPINSGGDAPMAGSFDTSGESIDINSSEEDTNRTLRSFMSLGTASFLIDSMKQLPGRKSMVLISGGLPILSAKPGNSAGAVSLFLNALSDRATRAGVAINTMDIRGLQASVGVASFEDTPANSAMGTTSQPGRGRLPDESQFGYKNPFDQMEAHQGLRVLANETGGIAVLNKNNFDEGLGKIIGASDAYYLLAYTPSDSNFKGDFRKVEIRVKNKDLKVLSRRGYFAREDRPVAEPVTKQEQVLAAIKSPVAHRDVDLEAMVLYKAAEPAKGAIDISIMVDPRKLTFETVNGKKQTNYDVVGFVFDELGKLRGGFNETLTASLTAAELDRATREGGLAYTTGTTLPAGTYQIRLAVRDNKSGGIGTVSRYVEVPDLSKGKLAASSMLLGAAVAGEMNATRLTPLSPSRRISRKEDLRYAVVIYNPKLKGGQPQLQTRLIISQNGNVIHKENDQPVPAGANGAQQLKVGQFGLSGVKPGRYTLTLLITDTLADKKTLPLTRSMDFVVVD